MTTFSSAAPLMPSTIWKELSIKKALSRHQVTLGDGRPLVDTQRSFKKSPSVKGPISITGIKRVFIIFQNSAVSKNYVRSHLGVNSQLKTLIILDVERYKNLREPPTSWCRLINCRYKQKKNLGCFDFLFSFTSKIIEVRKLANQGLDQTFYFLSTLKEGKSKQMGIHASSSK